MRSLLLVLALALAMLTPGCLQPGVVSHLGEGHERWTDPEADPWFALTRGCGFCMGSIDHPEADTLVLYENGRVLWFHFGFGFQPGEDPVSMEAGLEAWEGAVESVVPLLESYYHQERRIHVHELAVNRIDDERWREISKTLGFLEARVEDPGPPRYGCDDCSAPALQLLGERPMVAQLHHTDPEHPEYGNYRDGEPWERLLTQLQAISEWVQAWKTP